MRERLPWGRGILSGVASGDRGLSTRRQFLLLPFQLWPFTEHWESAGQTHSAELEEQMLELLRTVIILQERDLRLGWAHEAPGGAREETLCLPSWS